MILKFYYMYENGIICKRCVWKDCDLCYDLRNVFSKCENCEYRICFVFDVDIYKCILLWLIVIFFVGVLY